VVHLLYAIVLGLFGGAVGLLFIGLYKRLSKAVRPLRSRPIELALLGGLILGVVGSFLPLTLFSGEIEIQAVIDGAAEMGAVTLIVLGLMKVLLTVSCLGLGWSGGYIFPSFFAGAALGLAVHLIFPFIPEVVCMTCVIAGLSVALIKSPIALTFIVQVLFDPRLSPVIAIAVITAFILTYRSTLVPHSDECQVETAPAPPGPV
jgi:H+/Cl- antiporter ClcA